MVFLFTLKGKENDEYPINKEIIRIVVKGNLTTLVIQNKIDIIIYQMSRGKVIEALNSLTKTKLIIINHSCFLLWIYSNSFHFFNTYYKVLKNINYIISIVPFENDYLLKLWGIKSIFMTNFISYDYNSIVPSDLSENTILMIGRGNDPRKRFDLGIKAMKYIIKEIYKCEMKIISKINHIYYLRKLISNLNLTNYVKFVGYTNRPEKYFRKASLHIFPSIVESFGNVLTETLIYGIPNILVGIDYLSAINEGTIIIYDDSPISLARASIKILKNKKYKQKLAKKARKGMKKFNNNLLLKRWIKLIILIYNGKKIDETFRISNQKLNERKAFEIIQRQIKLLKMRKNKFKNITIDYIKKLVT
jgi:glycosyltransferase involved in cell wall biosynthesis